jgi:DNA-binding NtrC family response regulator
MMQQRNLLYYRPSGEAESLIPAIQAGGWSVHVAHTAREVEELTARHDIRVGLTRVRPDDMPDLSELAYAASGIEWVALAAADNTEDSTTYEVIAEQFYDYHTLPADIDRLLFSLGHAYGMASLISGHPDVPTAIFGDCEIVGTSPAMHEQVRNIVKIAAVDAPVLISGERGTGKQLIARAIHSTSRRAAGPFVAVDCGALPPDIVQSELFGQERGAPPDAYRRRIGLIESAAGGTIFMDEIAELPASSQASLLRFLQDNIIERVGGGEPIAPNVRVIAATSVDLQEAVAAERFRDDLYYRLHVLNITLPPLRDREGDIEHLARFFFDRFAREKKPVVKGFSQRALQAMMDYDWPGNVRELANRVRRAMVMAERRLITPEDLGLPSAPRQPRLMTLKEARAEAESRVIQTSLRHTRKNVTRAARALGVSRVTLYRLMDKYHISPAEAEQHRPQ